MKRDSQKRLRTGNTCGLFRRPQVFESALITEAYSRLMEREHSEVTDDAMAVEKTMEVPVKLF